MARARRAQQGKRSDLAPLLYNPDASNNNICFPGRHLNEGRYYGH